MNAPSRRAIWPRTDCGRQPERVLIVCGAQHGLAVAATALLRPGDVVAVDALTYYGFKGVAEAQRLELAPVPVSAGDRTWTRWNACAARAARHLLHADAAQSAGLGAGSGGPAAGWTSRVATT